MAATVDTNTVEQEILILRATGDEKISYLKKYPVIPLEDSFSLKVYRKVYGSSAATQMVVNTDYVMDSEKGNISYLVEFNENDYVYITEYDYETTYYSYLSSLRTTIGDDNFENIRYGTDILINYLHKAIFEKVVPVSGWIYTLDADVNRVEESIPSDQLGFIVDFAALILQKAELKQALRRAIVIADRSSKLDTTQHLDVLQKEVARDSDKLTLALNQYVIDRALMDSSLVLAIRDSIKTRSEALVEEYYDLVAE